jgi:hypothetical protein
MARKIIGIFIIVFGLVFLAGIISLIFFDINPLDFARGFFTKSEPVVVTEPATNETKPVENEAPANSANNGNNNRPANVRTIVVDDELLNNDDNPPVVKNTVPAFRRLASDVNAGELLKMASVFVERFGTYSNQSNYSNIIDLKMFMSEKMKIWADSYIADMRANQDKDVLYYGISTRVVNEEMDLLDEEFGEARIIVRTRRQEATGFTGNTAESFSQDIIVNMTKENQSWKIDSAFWQ